MNDDYGIKDIKEYFGFSAFCIKHKSFIDTLGEKTVTGLVDLVLKDVDLYFKDSTNYICRRHENIPEGYCMPLPEGMIAFDIIANLALSCSHFVKCFEATGTIVGMATCLLWSKTLYRTLTVHAIMALPNAPISLVCRRLKRSGCDDKLYKMYIEII